MQLPESIEALDLERLIPYARNSRTHSDEQVAQLASSIREFGFTVPVLIDEDDTIIAGHGRVLAARLLKLERVPCIRLGHLTEAQRRLYVIADNKLTLNGGWDDEVLRVELADLLELGADIELTGFSSDELAEYIGSGEGEMPGLPDGEKEPFQQMTFLLHESQVEEVKRALEKAGELGPYDEETNRNSNGNAIARVCEVFNGIG